MMWFVWTRQFPDPSRVSASIIHEPDAIPKPPVLVARYELLLEHRGLKLDHLASMECYALPKDFKATLEQDKSVAATKKLPNA